MNDKILVIDAHPVYSAKLEGFLKGLTFQHVTLCASGRQGLESAAIEHPGMVIVSGMLPDMDSRDVCRGLKALSPAMKIIVQVGLFTDEGTVARFKESGADIVLDRREKDLMPLQKAIETFLAKA